MGVTHLAMVAVSHPMYEVDPDDPFRRIHIPHRTNTTLMTFAMH